jgi:ABC-2 type transport system permease protein
VLGPNGGGKTTIVKILSTQIPADAGTASVMGHDGGIIDRFHTMAVSSGAMLAGHVGGGVVRTLVTTTVITGLALLVGFRAAASVMEWLALVGILAASSFALAWLSVAHGLVTKSPRGREQLDSADPLPAAVPVERVRAG